MLLAPACMATVVVLIEKRWPGSARPGARWWWLRVFLMSFVQFTVLMLAGITWDRWYVTHSALRLTRATGFSAGAVFTGCWRFFRRGPEIPAGRDRMVGVAMPAG